MMKYEPRLGEYITDTAEKMVALANENRTEVIGTFNGVPLSAIPETDPSEIVDHYHSGWRPLIL